MNWGPTGRARVDPSRPQAWAICDRCGDLYNHADLRWQFQWAGNQLINLEELVCERCYDEPAEFLRAITLPPDPVPILNPRPEPYSIEEPSFATTEVGNQMVTTAGVNVTADIGAVPIGQTPPAVIYQNGGS